MLIVNLTARLSSNPSSLVVEPLTFVLAFNLLLDFVGIVSCNHTRIVISCDFIQKVALF